MRVEAEAGVHELGHIRLADQHRARRQQALDGFGVVRGRRRVVLRDAPPAARNAMLQDILSVLHTRSQRFWAISLAAEGHLAEVIEEHRTIVATLQRHDADAAKTHVLSFKASMLNSTRAG